MNGEDHLFKRVFLKSEKLRFKQCYERTASPFIQKGFREKCGN